MMQETKSPKKRNPLIAPQKRVLCSCTLALMLHSIIILHNLHQLYLRLLLRGTFLFQPLLLQLITHSALNELHPLQRRSPFI